ncbi:DUF3662 domain-containing protein [Arcanobacterium phocisimile]|uniref:DUF3662 domain-containing protein n=1 Tax=Arcanobacterium phocisimile TaxID=1302235 RepID=A0ABX7IH33_9ACTO|nr:DUF3662 and FHA domain-containing protein [Arcanobacterium phocisimile]QRV02267.1 DUF3662 domain-containing protein [Arcanobacterium phocisimile]
MSAFDKIEKTVENAVENVFSRAFKSDVKPVELASAIKRTMDERSAEISRDRIVSPNDFTLTLSPQDFKKIAEWDEDALREELIGIATNYAREQAYVFLGPISVAFAESNTQPRGKIEVACHTRRGPVAPATTPHASPQNPIIDVNGERYILTGAVTVIGRGSVADIQLDDSGISRKHLELRVTPSGVIATDLNSTNGSFVEGHKISAATLVDGNTITIGHTRIMFWTSPEPQ